MKRRVIGALLLLGGMTAAVAAILIYTAVAGRTVLVKEMKGDFYQARAIVIVGNLLIGTRDTAAHKTKKAAMMSAMSDTRLAAISLDGVEFIEIIPPRVETPVEPAQKLAPHDVHTGTYAINAAGNSGVLVLRTAHGYSSGIIRFPNWGRGATETLKNVRIGGGKISFTRSVTTPLELKSTGANAPFVQEYSGEYVQGGKNIRGYYRVSGIQKSWDAARIK